MKIRTDFVTNSSSSSFVVKLFAELTNGTKVYFSRKNESGDCFATDDLSILIESLNKSKIMSDSCDPYKIYSDKTGDWESDNAPDEVRLAVNSCPSRINLDVINEAKDREALISALTHMFGLDKHAEDIDELELDEDEFDCENILEIIECVKEKFNSMADQCKDTLTENIKEKSDLKSVMLSMCFSNLDAFFYEPEDILGKIVSSKQAKQICSLFKEKSRNEFINDLRKMRKLKNFTDDALNAIADFIDNFSLDHDNCEICQTLRSDGKIDLEIYLWGDDFDFDDD